MALVALILAGVSLALTIYRLTLKRVVAQQFVLSDSRGRQLATLSVGSHGEPRLVFLDDKSHERLELYGAYRSVNQEGWPTPLDGAGIRLLDSDGTTRVSLNAEVVSTLRLADADGCLRADLTVFRAGQPTLTLRDEEGIDRVSLMMTDQGQPKLTMQGPTRGSGVDDWVGLAATLGRGLFLYGDRGELRFVASGQDIDLVGPTRSLKAGLYLFGPDGTELFSKTI